MEHDPSENNMLNAALAYARRGWPVFPVHSLKDGRCSCGNARCGSAGKHPMIKDNLNSASTDEDRIREWWDCWPDANIGLATGEGSGVFVVDLDVRNGGESTLAELEAKHGKLPETLKALTGGGGSHFFFRHPGFKVKSVSGVLGAGLDVKGDGGYVVLPPSKHKSGGVYRWLNAGVEVAEAPRWLLDMMSKPFGKAGEKKSPGQGNNPQGVPEGMRNDAVFRYCLRLKRMGLSYDQAEPLALEMASKCSPPFSENEARKCLESAWRYEVSPPRFELTDYGNAERLVARKGADIRYCHAWGKWLIWTGRRWKIDDTGGIERMAKETVRSIYDEAAQTVDRDRRKKVEKHAADSEKAARIAAMINLAQSERGIIILPEQLDQNPMLLNVRNGTLDLSDCSFYPHRREDLITKIANVSHDTDAECPAWMRFLSRITDGRQDLMSFLQRAAGYSLSGDISEQCIFFLHGTGANGKSTFLETLLFVLGDYAQQADLSTFLLKTNETIRNDLARLKGARFVPATEAGESKRLDEVLVKQVTGGDQLVARFLYQESFQFEPTFKIWLAANYKPTITGGDHAIWRRIRLVPFTVTIAENEMDKNLPRKLKAEASGILNWMLEGFKQWRKDGLQPPKEVLAATQGYREEMDVLADFLSEECETKPSGKIRVKELYDDYEKWCKRYGDRPLSNRRFNKKLLERGYEKKKNTYGTMEWLGIAFKA